MRKLWDYLKNRQALTNLLIVFAGIAFYMLLSRLPAVRTFFAGLIAVLSPLIWGAVIAYILNPLVRFLEDKLFHRWKKPAIAHGVAVFLSLIAAVAVFVLLLVAIIPQLVESSATLLANMEGYFNSFKNTLVELTNKYEFLDFDPDKLLGTWGSVFKSITDWLVENAEGILGASIEVGSSVVNVLLAIVLSIYLLLERTSVLRTCRRFFNSILKEERFLRSMEVMQRCDTIFKRFIGGNLLDSLIIGVANFIFMLVMGMPYKLLLSVIVALTNLIPTFGPIIGAVPCLIILLIINPLWALWFLIFTVIIQLLDSSVIKPLLFGDSTGLSPLWVLTSIIICGRLFGIVGMLIGIPVFAVLSTLAEDGIRQRLKKKGLDSEGEPIPPDKVQEAGAAAGATEPPDGEDGESKQ